MADPAPAKSKRDVIETSEPRSGSSDGGSSGLRQPEQMNPTAPGVIASTSGIQGKCTVSGISGKDRDGKERIAGISGMNGTTRRDEEMKKSTAAHTRSANVKEEKKDLAMKVVGVSLSCDSNTPSRQRLNGQQPPTPRSINAGTRRNEIPSVPKPAVVSTPVRPIPRPIPHIVRAVVPSPMAGSRNLAKPVATPNRPAKVQTGSTVTGAPRSVVSGVQTSRADRTRALTPLSKSGVDRGTEVVRLPSDILAVDATFISLPTAPVELPPISAAESLITQPSLLLPSSTASSAVPTISAPGGSTVLPSFNSLIGSSISVSSEGASMRPELERQLELEWTAILTRLEEDERRKKHLETQRDDAEKNLEECREQLRTSAAEILRLESLNAKVTTERDQAMEECGQQKVRIKELELKVVSANGRAATAEQQLFDSVFNGMNEVEEMMLAMTKKEQRRVDDEMSSLRKKIKEAAENEASWKKAAAISTANYQKVRKELDEANRLIEEQKITKEKLDRLMKRVAVAEEVAFKLQLNPSSD